MAWELTKHGKRYAVIGLLISAIGGIAYWLVAPESAPPSNQVVLDPELAPLLPKIEALKALALVKPAQAAEQAEGLLEELPESYRSHYAFGFNAGIEEIDFHGRVVDQYGQPLEGVHVPYLAAGKFLASGAGRGNVYTDADGRFAIKTRGGSLTLAAFSHPNIDFVFPPERNSDGTLLRDASLQRHFYSHQPEKGGTEPLWTACTAEQPCVFQAWRVEQYELVKSGSSAGRYVPDGRIYTLDFRKDMRHQKAEGIKEGHIRVRCTRPPMRGYGDRGDWSVTLSAVDGGIQPTDDYHLNLAPESGYQPEITITMTKGAPEYRDKLLNQRYYFTTDNGRLYGSLRVSFEPFSNLEGCWITINHFKFNPKGSRNLALRPRE